MAALVEEEHSNLMLCDKLYRLVLRPDWIIPSFAVLLLRSAGARSQIELGASGASSSMQNISQDVLRELVVAIPPLEEQAEIVAKAQETRNAGNLLVHHIEEHVTLLREYRSSLISAAVTGQIDINNFHLEAA
jgi:type I restriction enzyme S subunit